MIENLKSMKFIKKNDLHNGPRPRLIPVLLLKHGIIVRSQLFKIHQVIGNPMSTIKRYSDWNADEIVVLDISSGDDIHDLRRDDLQQSYEGNKSIDVLREVSKVCSVPLTFGGRIKSLKDIEIRLKLGADKVVINSAASTNKELINKAANRFGSQCIVAGIDAMRNNSKWDIYIDGGSIKIKGDVADWARELENMGAGEIFLNSIDRDGSAKGYDVDLIKYVTKNVKIPVIACGGAGNYSDVVPPIIQGKANAVAVANLLNFYELSYIHMKNFAIQSGIPMRPINLGSKYISREPIYDNVRESKKISERITKSNLKNYSDFNEGKKKKIVWCKKCTFPSISATPLEFDKNGVCTGCNMNNSKSIMTTNYWNDRKNKLDNLIDKYRSNDNSRHDVIIAVSGGKDSYFQVHYLKEVLGLNPLLVTYDGNNWTDIGWQNMINMRDAFNVDHVIIRPATSTLIKLNKLAFYAMGDMNWHNHVGIATAPMREAVNRGIKLVFYGEHGFVDMCGMFTTNDYPEVNYRERLEHWNRGFEWNYFVGRDGLDSKDMHIWKYPSDEELLNLDLRGIFLGNYVYWEANEHIKIVTQKYGFKINDKPFDRTYRMMSNLDDMHENGVHDYLKYIKFGYGRATDHTSKDIRAGLMDRNKAIELVNRYDPVKPSDLQRWLDYVSMSEEEFDAVADTFRDPRVWEYKNSKWQREIIK